MTHEKDNSALSTALEQIIENGFDGLDTAVSILINEAMRIERSRVLEAEPLSIGMQKCTKNRNEKCTTSV